MSRIEERLGCPIRKLPIGVTAKIVVNSHGHKGQVDVLRVVIMEDHTKPYIEFIREGSGTVSSCYISDYGLTWALSEKDWKYAKKYWEEHR